MRTRRSTRRRQAAAVKHNQPGLRRRNPFAVISDLLFDRRLNHTKPKRRNLIETLEERRLLTTVSMRTDDPYTQEYNETPAEFFVERDTDEGTLEVNFSFSGDAGEGTDFYSIPHSVEIPDGETRAYFTVTPKQDSGIEDKESIQADLEPGDYDIDFNNAYAQIHIYDDDIDLRVGNVSIVEGTGAGTTTASVPITVASPFYPVYVYVQWATADGAAPIPVGRRAVAPDDYTANGTPQFPQPQPIVFDGPGTEYVDINIVRDSTDEFDEVFFVNITSTVGDDDGIFFWAMTPLDGQGEVTILDDDGPTVIDPVVSPDTLCTCTCTSDGPHVYLFGNNVQRSGGLIYTNGQNPHPVVMLEGTLGEFVPTDKLESFEVDVRLIDPGPGPDVLGERFYNDVSGLNPGDPVRFSLAVDASSLLSGRYEWEMTITAHFEDDRPDTVELFDEGYYVIVVNRSGNQYGPTDFGQGWWLDGLDRLYPTEDGVMLVDAEGAASFFKENMSGGYDLAPHHERIMESFVLSGGVYTLNYHDGSKSEFSSDYLLTARVDRNGNETEFVYDANDRLITIVDVSGRETTLSYNGTTGLLESVTDFASRTTDFTHSNGRLTSIVQPEPQPGGDRPTVTFAYFTSGTSTGLLQKVTDERQSETTFTYDSARRLASTTMPQPQGTGTFSTLLTSVQSAGALADSPLADDPRLGSYTDPFTREFDLTTDRFGGVTSWEDPEQNLTTNTYDTRGRIVEKIEPDPDGTGPRGQEHTLYSYHATFKDKLTSLRYVIGQPDTQSQETDDVVHAWTYGTNAQVTSYTDPESRVTSYGLDTNGNVLTETQEGAAGTSDDLVTTHTYTTGGNGVPAGSVGSTTDPRGETIFHEYYSNFEGLWRAGMLKRTVYPSTVPLEEVTPVGSAVIIDNGDAGYSDADEWQNNAAGYGADSRYVLNGDSNDIATWEFADLDPGRYRVSATWYAQAQFYATEAAFTILDDASPRDKVFVNQRVAPNDVLASGVMWDYLSVVDIVGADSSLIVQLDGSSQNAYTIADAVRIERVGDLPTSEPEIIIIADGRNIADEIGRASFGSTDVGDPVSLTFTVVNVGTDTLTLSGSPSVPTGFTLVAGFGSLSLAAGGSTTFEVELDADAPGNFSGQISVSSDDADEGTFNFAVTGTATILEIVDDGGAGFATAGPDWQTSNLWGYGGGFHAAPPDPGQGDSSATWTFTGLEAGDYRVYADWAESAFYATDAPYTIYDGTVDPGNIVGGEDADLTHNPDDLIADLLHWGQIGGIVRIASSTLIVKLTNDADGYVFADAIRLERADVALEAPLRAEDRFDYAPSGNLNFHADELGRITRTFFDRLDRAVLVESQDPDGPADLPAMTTAYQHDAAGNVVTMIDTASTETDYQYTPQGWLKSVTRGANTSDSALVEWEYDKIGRKTKETTHLDTAEGDDRIITWAYSEALRTTTMTLPDVDGTGGADAPVYVDKFDLRGNRLQRVEPDLDGTGSVYVSPVTDFEYDRMNRVQKIKGAVVNSARPETEYDYNKAGQVTLVHDPENRDMTETYDAFGRLLTVVDELTHATTYGYDVASNLVSVTDELDQATVHAYDARSRRILTTDPRDGVTRFSFDAANNMVALTDSVGNTTRWVLDHLNRPIAETNELGDTRSTFYDEVGNVVKIVDRNERVREFSHDELYRRTEERWKDGANTVRTITSAYNDAGQLTHVEDQDSQLATLSEYTFTHDALGRQTVVDNSGTAGVPDVVLTAGYDILSRRTSLDSTIDSTADFSNDYFFDALHRMTRVDQAGTSVAEKRVDFGYNLAGQTTSIARYKDTTGGSGNEVATSAFTYHANIGLLTDLTHTHGAATIDYEWAYDVINRVDTFDSDADFVDYGYNPNSELTSASYTTQADESYGFDANGNRNMTGYTTGDNNQLLDDGSNVYTYDDEGNRTSREHDSGVVTDFEWDYRNRLVKVTTWTDDTRTDATKIVAFRYDPMNRRIAKLVDADGDEDFDSEQHFVYDGDHIALVFDASGSLTNRFLHGPAVDQILADEQIGGDLLWPLTDNLGTVRDIVDSDGDLLNHIDYDAFGKRVAETNAAIDHLFGFTGRDWDEETGLQYNRNRYYDPVIGRWISEDPIGFAGGDVNLARYVGNRPVDRLDPTGTVTCKLVKSAKPRIGPTTVKAEAGGVGVGVSPNPGVTGIGQAFVVTCSRKRDITYIYECPENIDVPCGPPLTLRRKRGITFSQEQTWTLPLAGGHFYITVGIEVPVPKVPGLNVTWYQLDPKDQNHANEFCRGNQPKQWPKHTPPPTIEQ